MLTCWLPQKPPFLMLYPADLEALTRFVDKFLP